MWLGLLIWFSKFMKNMKGDKPEAFSSNKNYLLGA